MDTFNLDFMAPVLTLFPTDVILSNTSFLIPPLSSYPDPSSLRPQDVLPHVALPLVLFLALFVPPFSLRGLLFTTFIALCEWGITTSSWPPNEGDTRPLKYGLSGAWIFVLPVVEHVLLHTPERDFWRVDDEHAPVEDRRPREFSLRKAWWALAVLATPRAVGWNFGSRKLNAWRDAAKGQDHSRGRYVVVRIWRAFLAYVALDAVLLAVQKMHVGPLVERTWDADGVARMVALEGLMIVSVYAGMTIQYEIAAAVGVALMLSNIEDWPPLWGNILDCYTVANVWGKFWHLYIRQPVLGFSHWIVAALRIPRRSILAYLIHLTTAFFISNFFHILSVAVVCEGHLLARDLIRDMSIFFMAQPVATVAETLIIQTYARAISPKQLPEDGGSTRSIVSSRGFLVVSNVISHAIGYAWVVCWFAFIGWWFLKPYAAVGVMEWKLPFSIIGWALVDG